MVDVNRMAMQDIAAQDEADNNAATLAAKEEALKTSQRVPEMTFAPQEDQYDYVDAAKNGVSLDAKEEGIQLPYKHYKPAQQMVAGNDLATGKYYGSPIKDGPEGLISGAIESIRNMSTNTASGPQPEISLPLSKIALQTVRNGLDFEVFQQQMPGLPANMVKSSWEAANRFHASQLIERAIQTGEIDQLDLPQEKVPTIEEEISMEELAQNEGWLSALQTLRDYEGLGTEGEVEPGDLHNWGLQYMADFNYNLMDMANVVAGLDYMTPQQKQALSSAMVIFDSLEMTKGGFYRGAKALATDPSNAIGLGFIGSAMAQGGKQAAKNMIWASVKPAMAVGAAEGAAYTTVDDLFRQKVDMASGNQEGWDLKRAATSAGAGVVIGGTIGGAVGLANKQTVEWGRNLIRQGMENARSGAARPPGGPTAQMGRIGTEPDMEGPFFNPAIEVIEKHLPDFGRADEMLKALDKMNGGEVGLGKQAWEDAMHWSGAKQYLARMMPETNVTKDQVIQHIKDNQYAVVRDVFSVGGAGKYKASPLKMEVTKKMKGSSDPDFDKDKLRLQVRNDLEREFDPSSFTHAYRATEGFISTYENASGKAMPDDIKGIITSIAFEKDEISLKETEALGEWLNGINKTTARNMSDSTREYAGTLMNPYDSGKEFIDDAPEIFIEDYADGQLDFAVEQAIARMDAPDQYGRATEWEVKGGETIYRTSTDVLQVDDNSGRTIGFVDSMDEAKKLIHEARSGKVAAEGNTANRGLGDLAKGTDISYLQGGKMTLAGKSPYVVRNEVMSFHTPQDVVERVNGTDGTFAAPGGGHFESRPNEFAHTRYTDLDIPGQGKVRLVDEVQSDLNNQARDQVNSTTATLKAALSEALPPELDRIMPHLVHPDSGFRSKDGIKIFERPKKAKELKKLAEKYEAAGDEDGAIAAKYLQLFVSSPEEGKAIAGNDKILGMALDEVNTLKNKAIKTALPDAPHRGEWKTPVLRFHLWKAIDNKQDKLAFPSTAEQVNVIQEWSKTSAAVGESLDWRNEYKPIIDRTVKEVPEFLKKDLARFDIEPKLEKIEVAPGKFEELWVIDLAEMNPATKKRISKQGQSFFEAGAVGMFGYSAAAEMQRQKEERQQRQTQ